MSTVCFSWNEINDICHGEWLLQGKGDGIIGITDDSRKLVGGEFFPAIVGELTDGHKYIVNAAQAGAACVCVEKRPDAETMSKLSQASCACLLVPSSLKAFQALASAYRQRFASLPLVGVTGSCGKTSTKEMCAAVLSRKFGGAVLKTLGNTNNFFGVPRNLLKLDGTQQAAVIEMGSNHPGEIHVLATMVKPTIGIICSIGAAHLEFFGDLYGVAEEKGDLLEALPEDGIAIIPGEATGLDILKKHAGNRRLLTFGTDPDNDVQGTYLGVNENGYGLKLAIPATGETISFTWPIGGAHQAINAAGAAAVGHVLGMSLAEIAEGLKQCELPGARMKVEEHNGIKWVNDAYNANPSSMRASLSWFAEICPQDARQTLVLGDMLELGDCSAAEHETLLNYVVKAFPKAHIITVGPRFAVTAEALQLEHYTTVAEAAPKLQNAFITGSWVFLKGSNSIGLAKLMPA